MFIALHRRGVERGRPTTLALMTTRRTTSRARERVPTLVVIAGRLVIVVRLRRHRRPRRTVARVGDPGRIFRNGAFYPPRCLSEWRGSPSDARRAARAFAQHQHMQNNQPTVLTSWTIRGKPGTCIWYARVSAQWDDSIVDGGLTCTTTERAAR